MALTKGRPVLCLMAVGSEERAGFVQPFAGVAVAVPGVVGSVRTLPAHVAYSSLQGIYEVGKRGVGRGLQPILVEPAAGAAKATIFAAAVVRLEAALKVAVGKIDLTIDKPARIVEQGRDIPRNSAHLSARQCGHECPRISLSGRLVRAFAGGVFGVLRTRVEHS